MLSIKQPLSLTLYNRDLITAENSLANIQGNRTLKIDLNIWCVVCWLVFLFIKKSRIIIAFS